MLVSELIAKLQVLPQNVPAAIVADSDEGQDFISAIESVGYDEPDNTVYIIMKETVERGNEPTEMKIEDRGPTIADLINDDVNNEYFRNEE